MEFGNMMFGNSRGNYHIPRDEGYEEQLERLFDAYGGPDWHREWGYSPPFENDTFEVFSYWWGDCECGFDERDGEWDATHEHSEDCYQEELNRRRIELGLRHWIGDAFVPSMLPYEAYRRVEQKLYDDMCAEYNKPKQGCAVHCTCDYEKDYEKWRETNDHDPNCGIAKPNFLYKPTGFSIS